jgi:transposase-like protein
MTTTATPPPRDGDPKPAFERVAAVWLAREVDGGQQLDPSELAGEVSVTPRTAAATLAALRASRERDPACGRVRMLLARDRIQAAFVAAELRGDGRLDAATLARQAGVTTTVARQWLRTFRAARASDPTLAGLRGEPAERRPATPQQLAALQAAYARGGRPALERRRGGDHPPVAPARPASAPGESRLAWIGQAACRDKDPELFFPERGHARQGTAAKQVCASCPVQGPCRDLAVRAASGRNDDHGIFGGTKPHERTGLRDNVPFDHPKAWLGDRAQAERAHQLAVEVGPQEAARRLGTYASTLRRAWDKWGWPTRAGHAPPPTPATASTRCGRSGWPRSWAASPLPPASSVPATRRCAPAGSASAWAPPTPPAPASSGRPRGWRGWTPRS